MKKISNINNFNYKNKLSIFLYMTIQNFKILQIHDFFLIKSQFSIFNISFYNPFLLPDKIPLQKKKKKISYIILSYFSKYILFNFLNK